MSIYLHRIQRQLSSHKGLVHNTLALLSVQVANYVLPLLTYPYLLRCFSAGDFGSYVFAQSVNQYFIIVTAFGLGFNAVREVAENRSDKNKVSEIFTSVFVIKLVLTVVCFVSMFFLPLMFEKLRSNFFLIVVCFGNVIADLLFPVWFFQGMESMKTTARINMASKIVVTISVFVFISPKSSIYSLVYLYVVFGVVFGLFSMIYAVRKYEITLVFNLKYTIWLFKNSVVFFLSRLSITFYTLMNSVLIGLVLNMTDVAYYNLGERLVQIARTPYDTFASVLYPYIARTKNRVFLKKIIVFMVCSAVVYVGFIFMLAPYIVSFFGGAKYHESVDILRIMSLIIIFVSASMFLGSCALVVFGKEKEFNHSIFAGTGAYVVVTAILYFTNMFSIYSVAICAVGVDFIILAYRYYYVHKFALLR